MELLSKEEIVIVHYRDNKIAAITHTNGSNTMFRIGEPMNRKELSDFYETREAVPQPKEEV